MAEYNELKQRWLMTQLSLTTPESIKNLERKFLYSELSVTDGSLHELWRRWLTAQGVTTTGSLADMWWEFLTTSGYSGSLREMQKAYWSA